jgi:5'-phosphate synthase pdxT subunit
VLIAERWGLVEPLRRWVHGGHPTWGTCAGMILLAERATGQKQGGQALVGGLDMTVNRNYFGRQVHSFEADLEVPVLGEEPVHAVFIRAPAVVEVGRGVDVLAQIQRNGAAEPVIVAARSGPLLATAFHPELTDDPRWHQLFVQMVKEQQSH